MRQRPLAMWLILVMLATMTFWTFAPLTSGWWLKALGTLWAVAYFWPLRRMVVSAFVDRAMHEIGQWPHGHPVRRDCWRRWDRQLLLMVVVWFVLSIVPPLAVASLTAFSSVMANAVYTVALMFWGLGGLVMSQNLQAWALAAPPRQTPP